MLRNGRVSIRLAELPEPLLEGTLVYHANVLLLAWRQPGVAVLGHPGHGLLIERFDLLGPAEQFLILGKSVFQLMDIAQEVDESLADADRDGCCTLRRNHCPTRPGSPPRSAA